jgi:hypothetical protein
MGMPVPAFETNGSLAIGSNMDEQREFAVGRGVTHQLIHDR